MVLIPLTAFIISQFPHTEIRGAYEFNFTTRDCEVEVNGDVYTYDIKGDELTLIYPDGSKFTYINGVGYGSPVNNYIDSLEFYMLFKKLGLLDSGIWIYALLSIGFFLVGIWQLYNPLGYWNFNHMILRNVFTKDESPTDAGLLMTQICGILFLTTAVGVIIFCVI